MIIAIGAGVFLAGVGHALEREFGLNWLFSFRGAAPSPESTAVVGINSETGDAMGMSRLPRYWPRSLHAVIVARLQAAGAPAIVFDMDFSNPRSKIDELFFADAIARHGSVVLFERLEGRNQRIASPGGADRWVWVETAQPPVEDLAAAARAIAPFPLPKVDDAAHQFWSFKPSKDDAPTTVSVGVQMALLPYHDDWRRILERAGVESDLTPNAFGFRKPGELVEYMRSMRKLFLGKPFLRRDVEALAAAAQISDEARSAILTLAALYAGPDERWTNFYGPPGTIRTVSYQDLAPHEDIGNTPMLDSIESNLAADELAGRTVFVGYSDLYAPDQPDRFYTVFTDERGVDLSGCEIMATAFANLLEDSTIRPLDPPLALALVVGFGLIASQLIYWITAYAAVPLVAVGAGGYAFVAARAFETEHLWLPLATPLLVQLPAALLLGLLGQYLLERRQKRLVGAAIANYLPEHIVKDLTAGRVAADKLDDVVFGVCLANDMAGFSSIAEKKSPGELAKFMNAYFDVVAAALKSCKVDVTEFHADTIMCAFIGKPEDPDVYGRAMSAALAVCGAIEDFAVSRSESKLAARVGLDAGSFYLGHSGGGGRMSYSILGNPANAAARLEGLNKVLGTKVLASGAVVRDMDRFALRPLGDFKVVGKDETASVVEILGEASQLSDSQKQLLAGFSAALEAFGAERWEQAGAAFERLAQRFPGDGPTAFYRDVCRRYVTEGAPEITPTRLAMSTK